MDPLRRGGLHFTQQISKGNLFTEQHQEMNMVRQASCCNEFTFLCPQSTADVLIASALYVTMGQEVSLGYPGCRGSEHGLGGVTMVNFYVGWIAILTGLVAGAAIGMFFHRDDWLEGYGSWRRRMLRLMHISLVGTGLLNLAFALSLYYVHTATAAADPLDVVRRGRCEHATGLRALGVAEADAAPLLHPRIEPGDRHGVFLVSRAVHYENWPDCDERHPGV